jgi:hypothetical protein
MVLQNRPIAESLLYPHYLLKTFLVGETILHGTSLSFRRCYMPKICTLLVILLLLTGCNSAPEHSSSQPSPAKPAPRPDSPTPTSSQIPVPAPFPKGRNHDKKRATQHASDRIPASVESPDPDAVLEQAADNLPLGKVAIQHPEQMKVSQSETVKVRISRDKLADLTKDLPTEGQVTAQEAIAVSTSMKVELLGPPYFDIKSLDSTEQLITNNSFTEWSFTVTPLRSGELPLHVRITAVIRAAGIEKTKDFPVKDEIINVRVAPLAAVGAFVAKNWQWLWSTILVPVALGLWKLRQNKNKNANSGKLPPPDDKKSEGQAA